MKNKNSAYKQVNEIRAILSAEEYTRIVVDNTVLPLTDEDDSEKLLSVKVDVGYE